MSSAKGSENDLGQQKLIKFLSLWIANSVVLNIASLVFRNSVVLGNDKLTKSMASVLSGLILTGLAYFVPKVVEKFEFKVKNDYSWQGIFFVANVIIIWAIKRLAIWTGLGVTNILYVIIVAAVLTLVQWKVIRLLRFLMPKK